MDTTNQCPLRVVISTLATMGLMWCRHQPSQQPRPATEPPDRAQAGNGRRCTIEHDVGFQVMTMRNTDNRPARDQRLHHNPPF
ncbi:hypothetical protein [Aliiruegeria haliotis]|uniref:hypothetical protein n=1 Tax=Aliiruegeria haliotis TaxID=1280846 RepID=UPI0011B25BB2|nr:hypothetical protein [Aliiruegeria haliotis]